MNLVNLAIVRDQTRETVEQEAEGVTVRMATITCPCGWKRGIMLMHQCLYCKVWLCQLCAEAHFGKTVEDYKNSKGRGSESA